MNVLKIITSVFIEIMLLTIYSYSEGLCWEKDKTSIIGFGFMEIIYALSLICMWV